MRPLACLLLGALACLVHSLFPWLCLTTGSDTILALHHRMVSHRVARPPVGGVPAAGD